MQTTLTIVGNDHIPVLVIDNLVLKPEQLVDLACSTQSAENEYQQQNSDYYPGVRRKAPLSYIDKITQLLPLFTASFGLTKAKQADVIMSAFSISTTVPEQLRPIQMLPHFDTPAENQFAMVHYLCDAEHGGTSIYRHKASGFERISPERLSLYRVQLKQQAIAARLHENPKYIDGDTALFSQIHSVAARMNRAIIYPSNALHSGNIQPELGLLSDPRQGRLTISSFVLVS